MKKFKTVLSLFDGISGTQVALERNGITYDNYYASEIDKYPITITQKNYPNTIQLGSVTDWKEWDIDWSSVDLVCGGFPCQSWSVAGLGLGDKGDVRGMLFWTMLDVMKLVLEKNPNAKFLMENVRMKSEFEDYITFHTEEALGKVNKHLINSALVSAQNRKRFYWTNIEGIEQPNDLHIKLVDVLEADATEPMLSNIYGGFNEKKPRVHTGKSVTIRAACGGGHIPSVALVDREKSYCIDASYYKGGNLKSYFEKRRRQLVFTNEELTAFRKLTPNECEALQTFPQGYSEGVSNTQRYRSLGNSFTVDVVAHLFKYL